MIIRDAAVPLAVFPYSSTSRVVHWLTRNHGRVATVLKGALRPKSPFLGEYQLFGTSELLYYARRSGSLHAARECALLTPRQGFRTDWRAVLSASGLTALFNRATPAEAHDPGLFALLEELLDAAEIWGAHIPFLSWAELRFCDYHGCRPRVGPCCLCGAEPANRFSSSAGGTVCTACAASHKLATLECPADIRALLLRLQAGRDPQAVLKIRLSPIQSARLNELLGVFLMYQFGLPLEISRSAAER